MRGEKSISHKPNPNLNSTPALPATMPDTMVASMGVFVFLCIRDRKRNSSPSSAMAKITRGMGNIEPNKLEPGNNNTN